MRHKLLTVILFAGTIVSGGHADEPAPEKQVAVLSEQHRKAAINATRMFSTPCLPTTGSSSAPLSVDGRLDVVEAHHNRRIATHPHLDLPWINRLEDETFVLQQAGGEMEVRLQSSHTVSGTAGREALMCLARYLPAPSRQV
jgi:hypothetical protein